jgi:hypothetical protein
MNAVEGPGAGSGGPERGPGLGPAGEPARQELQPLPYDGVLSVTVGTGVWLVALIVMLPFHGRLADDGRLWWIATAATGFGLGLIGIVYCTRRRNRLPPAD